MLLGEEYAREEGLDKWITHFENATGCTPDISEFVVTPDPKAKGSRREWNAIYDGIPNVTIKEPKA
jgi:hypothetical protein